MQQGAFMPGEQNADSAADNNLVNENDERKIGNPAIEGRKEETISDESGSSGDLDGGGGIGSGVAGGDEAAESGDKGPTPDKIDTGDDSF
jgi:hypothetical protein